VRIVLLIIVGVPLFALSMTLGWWLPMVAPGGFIVPFLSPVLLAIWVLLDAPKAGMRRWWALGALFLWHVTVPLYLLRRYRVRWGPLAFAVIATFVVTAMIPIHLHLNAKAGDTKAIVTPHDIEFLGGSYWWRLAYWGVTHGNKSDIVMIALSDMTGLDREAVRVLDYTNPPPLTFIAWSVLMAVMSAITRRPQGDRSPSTQRAAADARA